jgi:hypothetical protein
MHTIPLKIYCSLSVSSQKALLVDPTREEETTIVPNCPQNRKMLFAFIVGQGVDLFF